MLNIDDLVMVVEGAESYLGDIKPEEMTHYHRALATAIKNVTKHGKEAELALPIDKTTKRRGDWCQTRSLRRYFAFDPLPSDVDHEDVAFALANVTRFGGMTPFYPVSIHTWRVTNIAECLVRRKGADDYTVKMVRAYALVHDASEAYVGDMQRPQKMHMPRYREMESLSQDAIHSRFLLPPPPPEILEVVKTADELALLIEAEEFFPKTHHLWPVAEKPHAELDKWVRDAARLPMELEVHLETIRENIKPLYQHLRAAMEELLGWTRAEAELKELPEEQESSGQSSWRKHIIKAVDSTDPYALPEHLQKRVEREDKTAEGETKPRGRVVKGSRVKGQ